MKTWIKTVAITTAVLGLSACATKTGLENFTESSTTNYTCGSDQVTATFLNQEQNSIALVSVNGEAPILLVEVISASGAKYQGGIYELWTKGDNATFRNLLKAPKKNIQCKIVNDNV